MSYFLGKHPNPWPIDRSGPDQIIQVTATKSGQQETTTSGCPWSLPSSAVSSAASYTSKQSHHPNHLSFHLTSRQACSSSPANRQSTRPISAFTASSQACNMRTTALSGILKMSRKIVPFDRSTTAHAFLLDPEQGRKEEVRSAFPQMSVETCAWVCGAQASPTPPKGGEIVGRRLRAYQCWHERLVFV